MSDWAFRFLGLQYPTNKEQIDKQFRKLSKSCHPDLCSHHGLTRDEANETFQTLTRAVDEAKKSIEFPDDKPQSSHTDYGTAPFQRRSPQPSQVNTLSNGTVLITGDMKPGQLFSHLFKNGSFKTHV